MQKIGKTPADGSVTNLAGNNTTCKSIRSTLMSSRIDTPLAPRIGLAGEASGSRKRIGPDLDR
jgi:hypothetical protein